MVNRKRNIQMKFWVTEEEKRLIDEKMAQLPTKRYGAYVYNAVLIVFVQGVFAFFIKHTCPPFQFRG